MHRILLLLSLYLSLAAAWGFSKSSREASSSGSGGSDAYKSPKKHPPPRFLTRDCKNVRIMEYNQAYFLEAQCTRKGKFSMLGTVTSTLELDRCLGWDKASNNFVAQRYGSGIEKGRCSSCVYKAVPGKHDLICICRKGYDGIGAGTVMSANLKNHQVGILINGFMGPGDDGVLKCFNLRGVKG